MLWGLEKDLFWRQLFFWGLGALLFYLGKSLGAKGLFSLGKKIYVFAILFLLPPLLLGKAIRGSSRWINIAGLSIQPSELVKPLLVGFIAWQLTRRKIKRFGELILMIITAIIPALLIMLQPNLGSGTIVFATLLFLIFIAKPELKWWLPLILIFSLTILIGGNKLFHPYQVARIESFFNPYQDPLGKGYNLIQAKLAVGSGGFFGRGFGLGRQTQLKFLPEKHTDFIFAAIAEELGYLGVLFTLGFYAWFFFWLLKKVSLSKDTLTFYFRIGIFLQLFIQTTLNIAMNLQLFPIAGIPLPFLSYGGSSLISTLFSLGLFLM